MIKPTVGRVVWYRPDDGFEKPVSQPLAAIIAYVHSDTSVNLAVFNAAGQSFSRSSVTLYQGEGERPLSAYCEWMPYQVGQAAKTEALEKQLSSQTEGTNS